MALTEETFKGVADRNIFFRSWHPEGRPRAVVVVSHGFNAHSGQYAWVAEQLVANGFAVYALDHHGRGKSDGERFYVQTFSDYTTDLHSFIGIAKSREPDLPVFLLGHSAGGVIACNYVLDHPSELAGLICESFAFQVPAPDIALSILKGLAHLTPHLHVLKLNNKDFSRDPAVVAEMDADPLIDNETQPTQTVAEMVRADERLKAEFPLIRLPVFIIHGTEDKATKPSGSQFFYEHAGSPDKTLKLYEGHYHDLLRDIDKEIVLGDIISWINARLPV